ncbi:MAG: Peptidoglycan endopeptidase LytF [Chlamydiae bacterium]|nr:Peptidoglycan endopeptidase LytF [Chlamydiota bacterium]
MTRKDTITIAVLVNAALLIALFVTAIKRDHTEKVVTERLIAEVKPIALPEQKEPARARGDEVDQILKEFTEKKVAQEEKPASKIDFTKELEAITKAAAVPIKTKTVSPTGDYREVTVKKGDVLERIAHTNHSSVDEIMKYNHLSSAMLQIGQVIKVPKKGKAAAMPSNETELYTVKQGDNPWAIAVKNHMKLDELLKLNNLNEEKARNLRPGDKLRIRKNLS